MNPLGLIRSPRAALWAVLALALTLRVAACCWWQSRMAPGQQFEFGDSDAYWVLASHIAHGEPYEYGSADVRIFRMPGYPALLAPLLWIFGDSMPVVYARLLSSLFGTAAVAAVYWLATTLFDRRTGLLAALAAAIYPGAIAMSVIVLSEAPFCPLYLAQLGAWVKSWVGNARPRAWALASGVLGGLATLVRPDWLLFVPFAALVGLSCTAQHRRHILSSAVMLLGVVMVLAPWWWRNWVQVHEFVPTTLQVGASLYDGLNPEATGGSDMRFLAKFVEQERQRGMADRAFESRLDRRQFEAAREWAAAHPGRVIELAAIKFVRMWNIWPNDALNGGTLVRLVTVAAFLPAIVLALAGIWITRRQPWPVALCWLPAVYLTLLHLIFVSSIRYREPPMLGLLVFTAVALARGARPSPAQ
ncbi:MAG TPA: glycosyltransferase family 39 protein [Pirellulales bacterium]|nr:glycosyltransferase family 39 protein [Pirellulales bacterium]